MAPFKNITGIDTHAHIFRPDLPMAKGRRYSPDYCAETDQWLALQDRFNFSHGVLVQPSFLGTDNSFIEQALVAHPERLRAIAVVETDISEQELDRLDQVGFVGARLNLVGRDIEDYEASDWQNFFQKLAKRGWQIEIQRSFDDLASFIPAIAKSGVPVMIDHFGLPAGGIDPQKSAHMASLEMFEQHRNVWIKLSAPYRSDMDATRASHALGLLREACGGIDRFVWGSDWPHTNHEQNVDYAGQVSRMISLLPEADVRQQILVDNPARLFKFK